MVSFGHRKNPELDEAREQTEALNAIRDIFEGSGEKASITEPQKQALDILVPEDSQRASRRSFIALLTGQGKDYVDLVAAGVELLGWDALAAGREPTIPDGILDKLVELSSSIDGHRAREVVEVARSTVPAEKPPKKRGLLG